MIQYMGQYGWICPMCKAVNAPFVMQCPCGGKTEWSTTVTTSEHKHDNEKPDRNQNNYNSFTKTYYNLKENNDNEN